MDELPPTGTPGPREPAEEPRVWSLGAEMLGRSDYVRLVYECGLPEAEARELVGLEVRPVTPAQRGAPLTMNLGIVAPTAVVGPAPATAAEPPPPLWRAMGPETKLGEQAPRRSVPAWLAQGERLARLGSTGKKLPEPAPLVPTARLGCVLRQHLRVRQPGTRLDEQQLVAELSSCRPLVELPLSSALVHLPSRCGPRARGASSVVAAGTTGPGAAAPPTATATSPATAGTTRASACSQLTFLQEQEAEPAHVRLPFGRPGYDSPGVGRLPAGRSKAPGEPLFGWRA